METASGIAVDYIRKRPWLIFVILLLIIPALLINLDKQPFINDEAIRSVVALEMIFSGDYITPTLAGELYFKKPPVYNWLIISFFKISGSYSEYTVRSAAVFSLIVFLVFIYIVIRPKYGKLNALLASLMFLSCGRILFFDSFHGLIDIAFSALVYLSLMSIYHFYKREKLLLLFLVSYALTGLTFLMKGLPSLYFQAASLLVWFIYKKNFRKLLSLQHIAGILILAVIVGSYYLAYLRRNPGTLPEILGTLISESTQKTAIGVSLVKTFKHFVTFPFEIIWHFVPWTVFVIYLIRRESWRMIRKDDFMMFSLLIFAVNILIFWFSADTYARYLFIHVSILFPVLLMIHNKNEQENSLHYRIFFIVMLVTGLTLAGASISFAFMELTNFVSYAALKSTLTTIGILFFLYVIWKYREMRLFGFIAIILVFRISFNFFALPSRERDAFATVCRDRAIEIADKYEAGTIKLHKADSTRPPIHAIYYLSREWEQSLVSVDEPSTSGYYLIYEPEFSGYNYLKLDDLPTKEMNKTFSIVQIKE